MRIWTAGILALLMLNTACNNDSTPPPSKPPSKVTTAFDSFVFKPVGQSFRYLSSSTPTILSDDVDGFKIYLEPALYIYSSGNYQMVYQETLGCMSQGHIVSYLIGINWLRGQWTVDSQVQMLKLSDWGIGFKTSGDDGITFVFSHEPGRAGTKGKQIKLDQINGPIGVDEGTTYGVAAYTYDMAKELLHKYGHCDGN